jgi:hypothetical protein
MGCQYNDYHEEKEKFLGKHNTLKTYSISVDNLKETQHFENVIRSEEKALGKHNTLNTLFDQNRVCSVTDCLPVKKR